MQFVFILDVRTGPCDRFGFNRRHIVCHLLDQFCLSVCLTLFSSILIFFLSVFCFFLYLDVSALLTHMIFQKLKTGNLKPQTFVHLIHLQHKHSDHNRHDPTIQNIQTENMTLHNLCQNAICQ